MSQDDGRDGMPLRADYTRGALRISIGAKTLAFALENGEDNNPYNEDTGDFDRVHRVCDPVQFAKDVCAALNDEAEDGSTPLTRFLDEMMQAAIEQGSLGIEDTDD